MLVIYFLISNDQRDYSVHQKRLAHLRKWSKGLQRFIKGIQGCKFFFLHGQAMQIPFGSGVIYTKRDWRILKWSKRLAHFRKISKGLIPLDIIFPFLILLVHIMQQFYIPAVQPDPAECHRAQLNMAHAQKQKKMKNHYGKPPPLLWDYFFFIYQKGVFFLVTHPFVHFFYINKKKKRQLPQIKNKWFYLGYTVIFF